MPGTNEFGETTSGRKRLTGAAADVAKRAHDRREAAEAHLEQFEAMAQLLLEVLGADMIRAKLGRDRALKLFDLAGLDTERIAAGWAASDPVQRQVSRGRPDQGYDADPAHDPWVTQAVLVDRLPAEQVAQIRAEVAAEYAQRRAAAEASTRDGADSGIPGVRYADGTPLQRSGPGNADGTWDPLNHRLLPRARPDIWAGLPDHQPGFQDRTSPGIGSNGMPAPVPGQALPGAATALLDQPGTGCPESGDGRHAGGKFCSLCGTSLTGQQQD